MYTNNSSIMCGKISIFCVKHFAHKMHLKKNVSLMKYPYKQVIQIELKTQYCPPILYWANFNVSVASMSIIPWC